MLWLSMYMHRGRREVTSDLRKSKRAEKEESPKGWNLFQTHWKQFRTRKIEDSSMQKYLILYF